MTVLKCALISSFFFRSFQPREVEDLCIVLIELLFISAALQLPTGKTTVMHLVARENLPEPNNQGREFLFAVCEVFMNLTKSYGYEHVSLV